MTLPDHRLAWAAALAAVRVSRRAPLSARHALHAAVLLDQMTDLAYAGRADLPWPALATAGDFLAFRAGLRGLDPSLGALMDLCAGGADGPRLTVVATVVAPDAFSSLPVGDLMVSLYNNGTVPRLMLVQQGGEMLAMQDLLQSASLWWSLVFDH